MQTNIPVPAAALNDVSFWGIVAGNVLTMILAIALRWPASEIMWIYWWQSVFIGIANFYRIWNLKEFSTEDITNNGQHIPETPAAARSNAIFFAAHYGFFHFGYMIFLAAMSQNIDAPPPSVIDDILAFVAIFGFLLSHLFSLHYNATRDFKSKKPKLGSLMFYPYLRVLPMHFTIIIGGSLGLFAFLGAPGVISILLFIVLKTFADAGMHVVEHHIFRST